MKKRSRIQRPPPAGKPSPLSPASRVAPKGAGRPRTPVAVWLACIALAALTFAVFGRTTGYGFVNFDDGLYVSENPNVTSGLTLASIAHVFVHGEQSIWDPLTVVSHMADYEVFGLHAGGHHLVNVLLHAIAVVLLFLVLRRMTGAWWPSVLVAAVFAIHPLRVESVAWVTERKDVLSGVFFMLTLAAYVRYCRHPSLRAYALVILLFALGLTSKAMLVSVPVLLLVLDWWPLNRFQSSQVFGESGWLGKLPVFWGLLAEKAPMLLLSLAAGVFEILVRAPERKLRAQEAFPLLLRMENALNSAVTYVWRMFWPVRLAVFYPHRIHIFPLWQVLVLVAALAVISAAAFWCRRRHPYMLAGWLWYLITVGPVIGLVPLGREAWADRYTYLPQIGLYVALIWLVDGLSSAWRHRQVALGALAAAVIATLSVMAARQTTFWRDSQTLWNRAVACTSDNALAHYNLGIDFSDRGRKGDAMDEFQQVLKITPHDAKALNNIGHILLQEGRTDEALDYFRIALQYDPGLETALYNLGMIAVERGRLEEGIADFQKAIQSKPAYPEARYSLANALIRQGRLDDALAHLKIVIQTDPDYAEAYNDAGTILLQQGSLDAAMNQFQQALKHDPDYAEAHNNLAYVLIVRKRPDEAIEHLKRALQLDPQLANARYSLGMALLEKGRVEDAIAQLQTALKLQPNFPLAQRSLAGVAWSLATSPEDALRNGPRALELARELTALPGGETPANLGALAAAQAECGQYAPASATAQRALDLAAEQAGAGEVAKLRGQLAAYQSGRPFRDTNQINSSNPANAR